MKRAFLAVLLAVMIAVTAFAQERNIQPGNILVSGGLAIGNASGGWDSIGLFGLSLAADYALPMFGLTAGAEIGYLGGSSWGVSVGGLPIMGRLGYHLNFGNASLDVYGMAKIGFAMISVGDVSSGGLGFGLDLGGRYFFTGNLAAFAEVGFDNFFASIDGFNVSGRKFFTIGATYKFGYGGGRSSGSAVSSASGSLAVAPESDFAVTLGTDRSSAVITRYNGRGGSIIIPDRIQGMPVVQIAEGAFLDSRVTVVVIPEGVTEIGANAFLGCTRLTRVTLPSTISSIGSGAFNACGELLEVNIPDGVQITWNGNTFAGSSKMMLTSQARLREFGYTGTF